MVKTKAPKNKDSVEVRRFVAHDNLILSVIKRQAGTLAKAILEGVMNSIDAGASLVQVEITAGEVNINDDGKGFESADSIKQVFEVFGQPHELDDEGISTDAKFGTFRIGRGQLFAFGANVWRTNLFRMRTDIDKMGLQYELQTDVLPPVRGCSVQVELYESLSPSEIKSTVDEVIRLCRYVSVSLLVNGTKVSSDPASMKWDINHPLAYINCKPSAQRWSHTEGLQVYQQGVFVETIPAHVYGFEGTIVIKEPVQVNFARNQVIRRCKRWQKIVDLLKDTGEREIRRKTKLTLSEARAFLPSQILDRSNWTEANDNMLCFPDTQGTMWSAAQIRRLSKSGSAKAVIHRTPDGYLQVGFGPAGCRLADRVMQARKALVLDDALLGWMGYTPAGAMDCLIKLADSANIPGLSLVDYRELEDGSESYEQLPEQQWTKREKMFGRAASTSMYNLARYMEKPCRRLRIGTSTCAEGWTDGSSYVAVDRKWLAEQDLTSERGWSKVMLLLLHEWCHSEVDTDTHTHTPEFYRSFHDASDHVPDLARAAYHKHRKMLMSETGKLPKHVLRDINQEAEAYARRSLHVEKKEISDAAD